MWWVLLSAAVVCTVLYHARNAQATPPIGFAGTTLAVGRFGEISVFNTFIPPNSRQEWREEESLAVMAEDQGIVRSLRSRHRVDAGRKYRVAHAPWP
jgi:hypothetical protein